jgi:hypothetical protein
MPVQENPDLPNEMEKLPEIIPIPAEPIVTPSPAVEIPDPKQVSGIKKPKVPNPGKRKNNGNPL